MKNPNKLFPNIYETKLYIYDDDATTQRSLKR